MIPKNVQIQTTSACSGKCIICPYLDSWHKHHPGRMSDALFERILDQLAPLQLKKICPYLENEPLLDPAIFPRIRAIKERLGFEILEVSTNAQALDAEAAGELAELMAGIKHEIWISFHGVDRRTHEGVMGLDFEQCLANTVGLLKLSDTMPLRVIIRGAGMGADASLHHEFEFSEAEYVAFWEDQFKRHGIRTRPGINWIRYHDRSGAIRRNNIRLQGNVRDSLKGFHCPRVDSWLHFLYTGELCICCMDYHREQIFGDIRRDSLPEILNSEAYRNMRDMAFGLKPSPSDFICKRCISPNG